MRSTEKLAADRLDVDIDAHLRKSYEAGATVRDLATAYGWPYTRMWRRLRRIGVVMRRRGGPGT